MVAWAGEQSAEDGAYEAEGENEHQGDDAEKEQGGHQECAEETEEDR